MRKKLFAYLFAIFALSATAGLAACVNEKTGENLGERFSYQIAYAQAQELGYEGSLEEFIATISGKDGDGISTVVINDKGELIITLASGREINAGKVKDVEEELPDTSFMYVLSEDENSYEIWGIFNSRTTDIVIPATYKGLPVTAIGNQAFYFDLWITSVTMPEGLISIGDYAFTGAGLRVKNIVIPDSVEYIGEYAFHSSSLQSVTLGTNLKEIGEAAFDECDDLIEVINKSDLVLEKGKSSNGCVATYAVHISEDESDRITYIETDEYRFYKAKTRGYLVGYANAAGEVVLPETIEGVPYDITNRAFAYNDKLISVDFADGTTTIDRYAFESCDNLQSVTFGSGMKTITTGAFYTCDKLTNVCFGGNEEVIGASAFNTCDALTQISIPNTVKEIGDYAFMNCNLSSVLIPSSVKEIGAGAFDNCTALKTVTVSDGVRVIGNSAFFNCCALLEIVIPDSVQTIGARAFIHCERLQSVEIGVGVQAIGEDTFEDCRGLLSINVAEDNAYYASQNGVLYNKEKTEIIHIPAALSGEITIPSGIRTLGKETFDNCNIERIAVEEENAYYASQDGILYNKAKTKIVYAPTGLSGNVIISSSIQTIEGDTFKWCKFESIIIPQSVQTIEEGGFYGCNSLERVYYEGSEDLWAQIDIQGNYNPLNATTPTKYYYSEEKPLESGNYWHYDTDGVTPAVWS